MEGRQAPPTQQRQQCHDGQDGLDQQLDVGWPGVVDLEAGGQGALAEGLRVVAEEAIVVAQQPVVHRAVGVSQQQVLMLLDHLAANRGRQRSEAQVLANLRCPRSPSHLHHHGGVSDIGPPLKGLGPAHQRVGLIIEQGPGPEPRESLADLLHGLDLLL